MFTCSSYRMAPRDIPIHSSLFKHRPKCCTVICLTKSSHEILVYQDVGVVDMVDNGGAKRVEGGSHEGNNIEGVEDGSREGSDWGHKDVLKDDDDDDNAKDNSVLPYFSLVLRGHYTLTTNKLSKI